MTEIGKKHSFYELIVKDDYKIEIPIIQRDYAQGRDSATEIRIHFLKTLRRHLKKNSAIDLDFVYGSIESSSKSKTKFIPLDGQQRLTTLFLLHWYLSLKDEKFEEFAALLKNKQDSNFTYETRVSSREFCTALVSNVVKLPNSRKDPLSSVIRDSPWYYLIWDNDPTVIAMLNMLDSIHYYYFESESYYEKLTNLENPIITFQFIELKDFGLTDTLYIKMNARGKPLTDFENFKAKFEQILDLHDKDNSVKLKDSFSIKMDTVWTDLFWKYKDSNFNFDKQLMNLFRTLLMGQYALKSDCKIKTLQQLFDKRVKWNFYAFEQLKCFDEKSLKTTIAQMDLLADQDHNFASHLSSDAILNEKELFEKAINLTESLNITEALQFYALYQYIVFNESAAGLEEWMRVIRNLTEGTRFDEVNEYETSIKAITELLKYSSNILQHISAKKNAIRSFSTTQVEEERLKAALILRDIKWDTAIKTIENHKYLKGQIGFLLKFSGVTDNFAATADWDADNTFFNSFVSYSKKFELLFHANGLRKFENFQFERALLSKGDYTLNKGKNWSFLINGFERDISWKRLLRDDSTQRTVLKLLMDDIFDYENLGTSLQTIIESANVTDWRQYFISYPDIINQCGFNKFIRYEDGEDILLLEKLQTNGTHREYYTYALYCELKRRGNTASYVTASGVEYTKYISSINKKKIELTYNFFKSKAYCVEWEDAEEPRLHFDNMQEVIQLLIDNNIIPGD